MSKLSQFFVFVVFAFMISLPVYADTHSSEDEKVDDMPSVSEEISVEEDDTSDVDEEGDLLSVEEARDRLMMMPAAGDAVFEPISPEAAVDHYDIYTRQFAYRESAKDLRASLEERRDDYERPRTELLKQYRETRRMIFEAEGAAYKEQVKREQEQLKKSKTKETVKKDDSSSEVVRDEPAEGDEEVSQKDIKLTERSIPDVPGEEDDGVKKKVVTTEDAPDFDPSNL